MIQKLNTQYIVECTATHHETVLHNFFTTWSIEKIRPK